MYKEASKLKLRFNICKDIYLTKKAEILAITNQRAIKEEEQRLLNLIKDKKESLEKELSIEELETKLSKLKS
jgi:hypothetical protein